MIGEQKQQFLHKAEVSILQSLRHVPAARFSELMDPTGLSSDSFKFYIRSMVRAGWIAKGTDMLYRLTDAGKELANNLDEDRRALLKQPKLSVLMVVHRPGLNHQTEFLFQRRLRQPFYGRWGLPSGPIRWGGSIEEAAADELWKQTGLHATFEIKSFCRVADRGEHGKLYEDKLFAVALARTCRGELDSSWSGGENAWLTLDELYSKDSYFPLTKQTFELLHSGAPYVTLEAQYASAEY